MQGNMTVLGGVYTHVYVNYGTFRISKFAENIGNSFFFLQEYFQHKLLKLIMHFLVLFLAIKL